MSSAPEWQVADHGDGPVGPGGRRLGGARLHRVRRRRDGRVRFHCRPGVDGLPPGRAWRSASLDVVVKDVDLRDDAGVIAICTRGAFCQAVAILDLPLPVPRPEGAEWIDAYRHWLA